MPKNPHIKKVLVIGAGPIVIGQAAEFDYSGTQAIKALLSEGIEVVVVNSNPATIMTDPDLGAKVYIEPLTPFYIKKIIKKEKPDSLLPTMGGQTALNLAMELYRSGDLEKLDVEMIGASAEAIDRAENRYKFKKLMEEIQIPVAKSVLARKLEDGMEVLKTDSQQYIPFPLILRPSFTLGGEGGGQVKNEEEYLELLKKGLELSPTNEVLIEESLLGWKEFELEVVRDHHDNVIIVCSIENVDPMGIHTGDSITVAPAQTLTDVEYQKLRDYSLAIIRAVGVETGGSNVQFAVNPKNGSIVVIEMNPRVSRSSALASKATGFPIAKVATKLAIGYSLDEITNEITGSTPACFEPTIDYVVVKIPRFDFEKFSQTIPFLDTHMKSVGENMALGRTFKEALLKGLAGLENGYPYFTKTEFDDPRINPRTGSLNRETESFIQLLKKPHQRRLYYLATALRRKFTVEELSDLTGVDPWFIHQIKEIIDFEKALSLEALGFVDGSSLGSEDTSEVYGTPKEWMKQAKELGFSDLNLAKLLKLSEEQIREKRYALGIHPVYKRVDTCAAEFEAETPYLYSTYEEEDEFPELSGKPVIMILGGGPNRIGQGIEFDYCCVHACLSLKEDGYETVMVNCNPETVSTDWDTSDILVFDPVDLERVLEIARRVKPKGIIVQFGGQTPLKIAKHLEKAGYPLLGSSFDKIDLAEDRDRFSGFINELGLKQPENGIAHNVEEAVAIAKKIGFPVMLRPSYVLGGRSMHVSYGENSLRRFLNEDIFSISADGSILVDRFLDGAIEVDVDIICDGSSALCGGLLEHIEEAGIHSGDSMCSIPPFSLTPQVIKAIKDQGKLMALKLPIIGLMNVQFAVSRDQVIYVLEVNPRASRTVPFVSKATSFPLAKIASLVMTGHKLKDLGFTEDFDKTHSEFFVKGVSLPFSRFEKTDIILGPEMKSTGECMGRGASFPEAFRKALEGSGHQLPKSGKIFISIRDEDKWDMVGPAQALIDLGFSLESTSGTHRFLKDRGIENTCINKVMEGSPHCVEQIRLGSYALVINTVSDEQAILDSYSIRRSSLEARIPIFTTIAAAKLLPGAIRSVENKECEFSHMKIANRIGYSGVHSTEDRAHT